MAHTVTFDTYAAIKRLKAAGFDEQQAEALSETIREVQEAHLDELATKRDIELAKAELRKDIETAKVDTVKWVVATGIVILGGVAAINRLAPPPSPIYYHQPAQETRLPSPVPEPHQQAPVQPVK